MFRPEHTSPPEMPGYIAGILNAMERARELRSLFDRMGGLYPSYASITDNGYTDVDILMAAIFIIKSFLKQNSELLFKGVLSADNVPDGEDPVKVTEELQELVGDAVELKKAATSIVMDLCVTILTLGDLVASAEETGGNLLAKKSESVNEEKVHDAIR